MTLPLLALGAILTGSFRRNGFTLRMAVGVGLMVFVQALAVSAKASVESNPAVWMAAYVPVLVSAFIGIALLLNAARTRGAVRTT